MTRFVNPAPAALVTVWTTFAPTSRSLPLVVTADPLLLIVPLPCAAAVTSTGFAGSTPLYSAARISASHGTTTGGRQMSDV